MKFRVIARSLVALAAIVLTMMIALPAQAATATATFTKVSDWGSGFEGKYTITNGGTTTINGWSVAFDLPVGRDSRLLLGRRHDPQRPALHLHQRRLERHPAPGATAASASSAARAGSPRPTARSTAPPAAATHPVQVPGKPGHAHRDRRRDTSSRCPGAPSSGTVTGYRVYEGTHRRRHRHRHRAPRSAGWAPAPRTPTRSRPTTPRASRPRATRSPAPPPAAPPACRAGPATSAYGGATNTALTLAGTPPRGTVTGYRVYEGSTCGPPSPAPAPPSPAWPPARAHLHGRAPTTHGGESPGRRPGTATTTGCTDRPAAQALPHRLLAQLRQPGRRAAAVGACPTEYDLVAVAFAEADRHPRRGHLRRRPRTVRRARRLHRRPVPGRRRRRCTRAARRSSSRSAASRAGSPVGDAAAATNFANTRLRADAELRLRRRRHRPGERPQRHLHGARRCAACAPRPART